MGSVGRDPWSGIRGAGSEWRDGRVSGRDLIRVAVARHHKTVSQERQDRRHLTPMTIAHPDPDPDPYPDPYPYLDPYLDPYHHLISIPITISPQSHLIWVEVSHQDLAVDPAWPDERRIQLCSQRDWDPLQEQAALKRG